MVGVGRSDNQHIWIREKRDEDSGIAGRDDHHLVSHAGPRQHASKLSRRERLREPPRLDCQAGWGAVRGENQKQNVVLGVQPIGCDLQRLGQGVDRCTSALLGIVLHVDRASVEAVRYDLCRASSLASKHALVAEKAEGHHAHLASILNGAHRRNRRRDDQNKSDERRGEPADPRLGRHGEPRFVIATIGQQRKRKLRNYRESPFLGTALLMMPLADLLLSFTAQRATRELFPADIFYIWAKRQLNGKMGPK